MSPPLRVERSGPASAVARVTLDRPDRRNALDAELGEALRAAFASFADEPPASLRAVVVQGEGPTFCAGADVAWMRATAALPHKENIADASQLAEMFAMFDACPVPVVVRVQGAALGGGAGLCAVGDVVIAEAGARFGFPEVRLGLVPATIAPFVVRRIGEGAASSLFTTGDLFEATEAKRLGLVHRVVDGIEALDAAVDETVAAILEGGPEAVREAKTLARSIARLPGDAAAIGEHTARLLAGRRASAEAVEGLDAFSERRRPAWAPPEDERPT